MFKKIKERSVEETMEIVRKLLDIYKIDTVYKDIYLHRARVFISDILPHDTYHDFVLDRALISQLQNKISIAIEKADWNAAKELAERVIKIKERVDNKHSLLDLGKEVYDDLDDVRISPFLPGLHHLTGFSSKKLSFLRDRLVKQLGELLKEDPSCKDFYVLRHDAFISIPFSDGKGPDSEIVGTDESELRQNAQEALKAGDMEHIEKIAELFLSKKNIAVEGDRAPAYEKSTHPGRIFSFSKETSANAGRLGLVAAHVDQSEEYSSLYRNAFHPGFDDNPKKIWQKIVNAGTLPSLDISDALKRHVELFGNHTFINSGGTQYFPDFVAEDFLFEDFPELSNDSDYSDSELLSMLGFRNRKGLHRKEVEHALLEKGQQIVDEKLGLDPKLFRLVCIPPDLYLRLGQSRNWGKQEVWTHFDGYEISKQGRLSALAGGDSRFGGIYDLVSIGREYNPEHLIVRFAVVQRERMLVF
ncbi:MAG: hypothetical protein JXA79_03285 [Deltaproteobacteria bacterium]|nr:hypothetical protein [Deltaproteobacteria bacterium]